MTKIDISSSTLDKGLELAQDFLARLINPAAEEVGLLLREQVSQWRLRNQVRLLTKAQQYCHKAGIAPKALSLKLLCPLLEFAALEEDEALHDKWAILLGNLVDSEQNIQNHVFPYILSQLSVDEFRLLECVHADKKKRVATLSKELEQLRSDRPALETDLADKIIALERQITALQQDQASRFHKDMWDLRAEKHKLDMEVHSLKWREGTIQLRIEAPQSLPDDGLRAYEVANVVRLGLARWTQETVAHSQELEIDRNRRYVTVDVELETQEGHILTELGELFLSACTEKHAQTADANSRSV